MVISCRRFAENGKETYRNKKKAFNGPSNCFLVYLICTIFGVVDAIKSQILNSLICIMMNTRQVNMELIVAATTATAAKASLENIHLRNADYFMIIASFL